MPALVAGIHVLGTGEKTWMAGTSPAMTIFTALQLKLAAEGTMLQRSKQGVELGEVGAVLGFELVDLGDAGGKFVLHLQRGQR